MKKYRVGVIGFAHMHINTLLDDFAAHPQVEWVACADTVPLVPTLSDQDATRVSNLRRALEKTGIPKSYDDYREMLDKERFDIVLFCPENARHAEVCEAIAAHGAHMITEKPMAASLSDALRMERAVKAAGVVLAVNWPISWSSAIRKAKELIDRGEIGEVWEVKWRNGNSMGPFSYGQTMTDREKGVEWWHQSAPGGGAMLDYCCYGAILSRWYFGEAAEAAWGIKANVMSHYGDAEDNGVITVRFPKGIGILEGSWTTVNLGVPPGPYIYGSEGTLIVNHPERTQVAVYRDRKTKTHEELLAEVNTKAAQGYPVPSAVFDGDDLPEGRDRLSRVFIHHLETGDQLHPTLDLPLNIDAMAILDAGIRAAYSGKMELVNDVRWSIG